MGRTVGAAIEMGAVAACLPVEQPPRRMIPGHQLVVEQQVAVARRRQPVLVRGAPQPRAHAQPGKVAVDGRAQRLGQEVRPDDRVHLVDHNRARDPQVGPGAVRALRPRPLAPQRQGGGAAHGIVDGAEHHFSPHGRRRHDPEQGHSGSEVLRAVERIEHEGKVGGADRAKQRGVPCGGLLADHDHVRVGCRERGGHSQLGRLVRVRHEPERGVPCSGTGVRKEQPHVAMICNAVAVS